MYSPILFPLLLNNLKAQLLRDLTPIPLIEPTLLRQHSPMPKPIKPLNWAHPISPVQQQHNSTWFADPLYLGKALARIQGAFQAEGVDNCVEGLPEWGSVVKEGIN